MQYSCYSTTLLLKRYCKGINQKIKYVSEPIQFNDASLHDLKHFIGSENRLFEEKYFRCPLDCNQYLTDEYGDYMQLPSLEERKTYHGFINVKIP